MEEELLYCVHACVEDRRLISNDSLKIFKSLIFVSYTLHYSVLLCWFLISECDNAYRSNYFMNVLEIFVLNVVL